MWFRWPVLFPDVWDPGTCCVAWGRCNEITEIQLLSHAAASSGRLTSLLEFLSLHFAATLVSVLVSTCHDKLHVTRPVISEPNRCSVVGVVTSQRAAERRIAASITCRGYFSRLQSFHAGSGIYPVSYSVGTGGSFPGSLEVGAPLSTAQVNSEWSYSSTPNKYAFMA